MNVERIRQLSEEKFIAMLATFNKIKKSPLFKNHELTLNPNFLVHACESCFVDLARHKDFHGMPLPDNHKRAAFLFKWVAAMRPLWATGKSSGMARAITLHANSYFALLGALAELNVDMTKFAPSEASQHVIYSATYRHLNPETWALLFFLIEQQFAKS